MSRTKKKIPSYCRHKASGRAVVRIDGDDHYLGPYDSPESWETYYRLIAEWKVRQSERKPGPPSAGTTRASLAGLTVSQVLLAYWQFAQGYYVRDGRPTSELAGMKDALKPVRELYGRTAASEFGPLALKAVRAHMVSGDLCRTETNKRINRIKRVFKWAVSEELIPASVQHGLQSVAGLRKGRCDARESLPVKPVPDEHVNALLPFLSPPVRAMVTLQRLTGMRPGEVVLVRKCDIDMTTLVWIYQPSDHKNSWREQDRIVPLGPKAQEALQPFLDRPEDAFLFSPADAEKARRQEQQRTSGKERKTPIYPSELRARERRKGERSKRQRKRPFRARYDRDSYRRAIEYAINRAERAGIVIPHWHPHQLRHARATELRRMFGIEAAQVSLGHARADVTEVYAERNLKLAIEVAAQSG